MGVSAISTQTWSPLLLLFLGATVLIHLLLAVGVYRHARGHPTLFVGPVVWTAAVLLGGVLGVGVYWAIHVSSLGDRLRSSAPFNAAGPPAV